MKKVFLTLSLFVFAAFSMVAQMQLETQTDNSSNHADQYQVELHNSGFHGEFNGNAVQSAAEFILLNSHKVSYFPMYSMFPFEVYAASGRVTIWKNQYARLQSPPASPNQKMGTSDPSSYVTADEDKPAKEAELIIH